jgi:hypothetical protein
VKRRIYPPKLGNGGWYHVPNVPVMVRRRRVVLAHQRLLVGSSCRHERRL